MRVIFWRRSGRITKDDMWNKKRFSTDNAPFYVLFLNFSNLIDLGVRTLGQVCVVRFVQKVKNNSFSAFERLIAKVNLWSEMG